MKKMNFIHKKILFFSPEKITDSGQLFRMYREDIPADSLPPEAHVSGPVSCTATIFRVHSGDRILLIIPTSAEDFFLSCTEEEWSDYWAHYFDCDTDYPALYASIPKNDAFVSAAAADSYGVRVLNQDLFEMIISFIISQQNRIPKIRKSIEALCERFGKPFDFAGKTYYAFPTPEAIAACGPGGLAGLSLGYRERYIYESALKFLSDDYIESPKFRTLPYSAAKEYLKSYCGIGEKVANCICLFALGYKDAFPIDVHIKDILHREYNVGDADYRKLSDSIMTQAASDIFAYADGFKGILQQWIFAYELKLQSAKIK